MSEVQQLFGVKINALSMDQAVDTLNRWNGEEHERCRFVVTPNVDHAVLLNENKALLAAYEDADMILPDGYPIVWASRLLGRPLPERVTGSDLVPNLFSSATADDPLRVFLLGAAPGVAQRAAENMKRKWHNVKTVGTYSPPMGFEKDPDENDIILGRITLAEPDVVIVGLGAPKQELWVHQHCDRINAKFALCVGATIDFLAGEKKRAPKWMQKIGIEWLHRMMTEPKRLIKRYARDAWVFPQLVWKQWRLQRTGQ